MLNLSLADVSANYVSANYFWANTSGRVAVAAAVTVSFAVLARALRGVDVSGALAGGIACFILYASAGPGAFAALAALFLLTWAATRRGSRRKQELGVAERGDGRNGWQVLANLGVSASCSALVGVTGSRAWLLAAIAAMAEAATDTLASEIGQAGSRTALLITTWKPVPAGVDGGITLLGTLAGAAGGMLIAAVAGVAGLAPLTEIWIPVAAGFAGMLADSLLGATFQRRGWINNEAVNLFGTLAAAAIAYWIAGFV